MTRRIVQNGLLCAAMLFISAMGHADSLQSSSLASPTLAVATQIAVQATTPTVLIDFSGKGEIDCTVEFGVEANVPRVRMSAAATNLHFMDDLEGSIVHPIPLIISAGILIEPQGAQAIDPASNIAQFAGDTEVIDGLTAQKTEEILFESSDPFTFSHPVLVTVKWNQDEDNKPAGQYEGRIKLTCMIEP